MVSLINIIKLLIIDKSPLETVFINKSNIISFSLMHFDNLSCRFSIKYLYFFLLNNLHIILSISVGANKKYFSLSISISFINSYLLLFLHSLFLDTFISFFSSESLFNFLSSSSLISFSFFSFSTSASILLSTPQTSSRRKTGKSSFCKKIRISLLLLLR